MSRAPLFPQVDNFTPPERTPWGGFLIAREVKKAFEVDPSLQVGESWEISDHPSFPNLFAVEGKDYTLGQLFPGLTLPFLVKFLNSGSWEKEKRVLGPAFPKNHHDLHMALKESPQHACLHQAMLRKNLSVQVHPKPGDIEHMPSKTECWLILASEPGAGIYLDLCEGVDKKAFSAAMESGEDLSVFLQFQEVQAGEVYFIPAGTFHAIGAGVLLLEVQERSESTFRAYDWGRPRQLHIQECLKVASWETGNNYRLTPQKKSVHCECLVDVPEFRCYRWRGELEDVAMGPEALTVLEGCICINGKYKAKAGQSLFIPPDFGPYSFQSLHGTALVIQVKAGERHGKYCVDFS